MSRDAAIFIKYPQHFQIGGSTLTFDICNTQIETSFSQDYAIATVFRLQLL